MIAVVMRMTRIMKYSRRDGKSCLQTVQKFDVTLYGGRMINFRIFFAIQPIRHVRLLLCGFCILRN